MITNNYLNLLIGFFDHAMSVFVRTLFSLVLFLNALALNAATMTVMQTDTSPPAVTALIPKNLEKGLNPCSYIMLFNEYVTQRSCRKLFCRLF